MDQFISEPISPEPGSFSTDLMARGLASPPGAFTWRDRRYLVLECLSHEKRSSREGGSGELYLRRQVFTVRLESGQIATIYLERQPRRGGNPRQRWFLYSIQADTRG